MLIGLGVSSLTTLRSSVELDQAYNDFAANLRLVQNNARNSVVSQTLLSSTGDILLSKVEGFAIYFETGGNYTIRYCTNAAGSTVYNCTGVENSSPRSAQFSAITVTNATSNCKAILFKRATSDISAMSAQSATPTDVGTCVINLVHPYKQGQPKSITIDVQNNNIISN